MNPQPFFSAPPPLAKVKSPVRYFMFRPSALTGLLCHLLTSASPSRRLATAVAQWQTGRPPRILRTHLHTYARCIYVYAPSVQVLGLETPAPSPRCRRLVCSSCSSGQCFACGFLQIPPHGGHPCRPANDSPCRVRRGLAPPSEYALPGVQQESGPRGGPQPLRKLPPSIKPPLLLGFILRQNLRDFHLSLT